MGRVSVNISAAGGSKGEREYLVAEHSSWGGGGKKEARVSPTKWDKVQNGVQVHVLGRETGQKPRCKERAHLW